MSEEKLDGPAASPCVSCPYRKDVPSGVWHPDEYAKLPMYDGEPMDQIEKGGFALFYCHQRDGQLCAGWVGCHNPPEKQSIALRFNASRVTPETFDYVSPVPLFESGQAAAEHGLKDAARPGPKAHKVMDTLLKKGIVEPSA